MREMFLRAILTVDETMNMVTMILSIVSGILAIVAEFRIRSRRNKKSWVVKLIIILSIIVVTCTVVRKNITQVPDIVGKTYSDACNTLSNNDLSYNLVLDNGIYVMEQDPVAGTIVEKNSRVELVTEPIGNNAEVKRIWEESLNVSYGNVAVTFKDTNIILEDAGKTVQCYGNVLKDYTVKKAYLLEKTVGVEYHDYILQDNVMIFKNIPQGIPFQLIVLLEGYEEASTEVTISSQNMEGGTYHFTWAMMSDHTETLLPIIFYVADGDKSTVNNVKYLSDVQLWVQWPDETVWNGDYYTDREGAFPYGILINRDQTIRVKLKDPFENGNEYECELTLHVPEIGEANPKSIIFVKKNGSCNVVSTDEYFMW